MPVRDDPVLTISDVAARLGVGERFVRRLVFERRIKYHKVGRHVRFAPVDIEAYIQAARRPPRNPTSLSGRVEVRRSSPGPNSGPHRQER